MRRRTTALAPLAAASARGDAHGVAAATAAAIREGCSAAQVRETLRMVHLFCGFPRALDALASAAPHLPAPPRRTRAAGAARGVFVRRGRALFERVYGPSAGKVRAKLARLDPMLTAWVLEDAYGRVLARPQLPAAERERLAVVFLAAQSLRNQLPGHVRGALRCGATPREIEASLAAAAPWIAREDLDLARSVLSRGLGAG